MKTKTSKNLAPVEVKERIISLDIIRGFALLGILFVNIFSFSGIQSLKYIDPSIDQSNLYGIVQFFFRGKFISLFSILFGIGFALQISKFHKSGPLISLYWRRMIVLFIFGLLHLILDPLEVLNIYAFCGILLLIVRKVPNKIILIIAVIIMALPYLQMTISTLNYTSTSEQNYEEGVIEENLENSDIQEYDASDIGWDLYASEIAAKVYSEKGFVEILTFNMDYAFGRRTSSWLTWLWFLVVLPFMLIGYILGKLKLLENEKNNSPLFKKVFWIGLSFGILGTWFSNFLFTKVYVNGWSAWFSFAGALIFTVSNVITALAYSSGLLLLLQKSFWKKVLLPLKFYGRMALTNYILQTVICICLFYNFGFDLFGKLSVTNAFLVAIGIHLLLIFLSSIWLKKNRYGPFEWLWRYLTYWKI